MKLITVLKCRRSVSLTWKLKRSTRLKRRSTPTETRRPLTSGWGFLCFQREQRHRELFTGAPLSLKLITRIILLLIVPRSPTEPGNDADSIYQGWRWGQKGSGGLLLEKCANNSVGWIPPVTVHTKNKVGSQEFKGRVESWVHGFQMIIFYFEHKYLISVWFQFWRNIYQVWTLERGAAGGLL